MATPATGRENASDELPRAAPTKAISRGQRWRRRLLALLALYAAWLLLFVLFQDKLIFLGTWWSAPGRPGPETPDVRQLWIEPAPGIRVEAWCRPGAGRSADHPGPALLFLHGNKHHVDQVWRFSEPYVAAGYTCMVVDYRGFGRSTGRPAEPALIRDTVEFLDMLASRAEVDPRRIVLHGNSLGGAIALAVASERPVAAVVLESTFTSMPELFPRLAIPPQLCRHRFDSVSRIRRLAAQVLVVHGSHDWVMPDRHGKRLAREAPHGEFVQTAAGHTHYEPCWHAIAAFLTKCGLPAPAPPAAGN